MSAITAPLSGRHAQRGEARRPVARTVRAYGPASTRAASRRRSRTGYAIVVATILATAIFGVVALNAMAAASAVEARGLEERVAEGERRYGHLVAEVAALEDPGRVRDAARELGMVEAGSIRYLPVARLLPADGAVGESATSPLAADPVKSVLSMDR